LAHLRLAKQMPKTQYQARKGFRLNDEEAQVVGEELERLKQHDGDLRPERVVKAAEDVKSRLHKHFTWDDEEAAFLHRVDEARYLIRSIEVYYIDQKEETKPIKAFYNVVKTPSNKPNVDVEALPYRTYVSLQDVLENNDYRSQVIVRALQEAEYWAERYRQYQELEGITTVIDEHVAEMRGELKKESVTVS
jgi:hypothetical protein